MGEGHFMKVMKEAYLKYVVEADYSEITKLVSGKLGLVKTPSESEAQRPRSCVLGARPGSPVASVTTSCTGGLSF